MQVSYSRPNEGQHPAQLGARDETYGAYLGDLFEKLPQRPDLLFLMSALQHYRRDDQPCRDVFDRLVNLRFKTASGRDARAVLDDDCRSEFDDNYWRRQWAMREKARAIIEGRREMPDELLPWKQICEIRYYHGKGNGRLPPWLDEANMPARPDFSGEGPHFIATTHTARRARK